MANTARALVEAALRARKLDTTLTTALPPPGGPDAAAATTVAGLDRCLQGGLPRGQVSDLAGARSSGRTTLLMHMLAAATRRGEMAALVDAFDALEVASAVEAGVALDRLLWIRGQPVPAALLDRGLERAVQAVHLVLQAGGFGLVALDLGDAPPAALARVPFTTWLRIQRTIEGSETACVLVGPHPLARSAGGVTLALAGRARWEAEPHAPSCGRRLAGLDLTVRVVSPRRRVDGEIAIAAAVAAVAGGAALE